MEADYGMACADASSGQEQDALKETVTVPEATGFPVETPGMLAPNLLDGNEAWKKVFVLLKVQRDLFEKMDAQKRDLLEIIDAQKKEVTALRQELRALISKTDAQEEMERALLNEHQKVLDLFGAEKESLGKLLQESKREVGVRRRRESVLLQERQALIDEIRALQQEKKQSSSTSTVKGKKLKIEQVEVQVMISHWQKNVLDLILGRTKVAPEAAAALPEPPDQTQTMEQTTRDCSGGQSE